MVNCVIDVGLRPIRIAYIIDPADNQALHETIKINSVLWGGIYNPIIPYFKKMPALLRHDVDTKLKPINITIGYIENFDPDYIIIPDEKIRHLFPMFKSRIIDKSDIFKYINITHTPLYGIGLFEIMKTFYENELKYIRQNPLNLIIPNFNEENILFLSAVFGSLHEDFVDILNTDYKSRIKINNPSCFLDNYINILNDQKNIYLHRLFSKYKIDCIAIDESFNDHCLMIIDAQNNLDIIDFWNLRAAGWDIVPLAKQAILLPQVKQFVEHFINSNYKPSIENVNHCKTAKILKGRSLHDDEIDNYVKCLVRSKPLHPMHSTLTIQRHYPRIWDKWARNHDHINNYNIYSKVVQLKFDDVKTKIAFDAITPDISYSSLKSMEAKFINEINLKIDSHDGNLYAEIIPDGINEIKFTYNYFESWRTSKNCIIYAINGKDRHININLPLSEEIFIEMLKSLGWNVALSPSGLVAKQILKCLKDILSIDILCNPELLSMLEEMSGGKEYRHISQQITKQISELLDSKKISKHELTTIIQEFFDKISIDSLQKSNHHKSITSKLSKIYKNQLPIIKPENILNKLINHHILKLGLKLQCPTCQRFSLYMFENIGYKSLCHKCDTEFFIPQHTPEKMVPAYRTTGAFSLPNYANGAYPVLMTLRYIVANLRASTTSLLSFTMTKESKNMEIDLGLYFRLKRYGIISSGIMFAECKAYDEFTKKDFSRMYELMKLFPGAIIVFSTLKNQLSTTEQSLIKKIADKGKKYKKYDSPLNPVLILTGAELFNLEKNKLL